MLPQRMSYQFTALLLMLVFFMPAVVSAEEDYWEYTFRPGDTIWDIAKKYTTSVNNWDEIQNINLIRLGADRKIRPGTRIVIPVSMLKLQPTPALVIALDGEISVFRANDGERQTLTTESKLYSGDRIVTDAKQSVRLQFADQSELQILPNSEVVLDKLSHYKKSGMVDTRIRLNSGAVNTQVEKQRPDSRYQITTPSAITAVRGTSFRLSTDEQQISRTEVTGGMVAVSAGQSEKSVKDGFGIVAEKDKPLPEPVKLLAAPVITIKQPADNMLVSTGFMVIQSIKANISNELIYMWLTNEKVIEYLHSKAEMSVSTYPSIKPEDIEDIDVIIPNNKCLLNKIQKSLSPIFNSQWERNNENKSLYKLEDLLLSKMSKVELDKEVKV